MQSGSSLSVQQRDTLETVHTTLQGIRTFLESLDSPLGATDKLMAQNLCLLAELCEQKLADVFPDLRVSPRIWDAKRAAFGGRL
jgi:hypothetical protein